MKVYLASHYRDHPHGVAINQFSIRTHGAEGLFGHRRHATHVYVVAVDGSLGIRLDGDVPVSRTRSLGGLRPSGVYAPRWFRMPDADAPEALRRLQKRIDEPAVYDGGEIVQAALRAIFGRLPFLRPGADPVKRAMICTRLAAGVLGLKVDDLFPEACVKAALASGYVPVRVADVLEGVVVP